MRGRHAQRQYRARVVVGADGRHSTVAELAGAKEYLGYDNPRFYYWAQWPDTPAWPEELRSFGSYLETLRESPVIRPLLDGNAREGKLVGLQKSRFYFREAAGPGFALVGDAGLHKDPVPGYGMTDALRDGRNLGNAILAGGDDPLVRLSLIHI